MARRHDHRTALQRPDEIMLRITPRLADDECVLKLEGSLTVSWVPEVGACWCGFAATAPDRPVRVDLTDVSHVDPAGRALMTLMYRAGVRFIARGFVMPDLVRDIAMAVENGSRR
jgi:ABC-type transporter Mla MlaB component